MSKYNSFTTWLKVGVGHLFLVSFWKGLATMNKLIIALIVVIAALSVVACNRGPRKPTSADGSLEEYYSWECDRKVPKNKYIDKKERKKVCSQYLHP